MFSAVVTTAENMSASYNVVSSTPRLSGFELPPLAVIGTDYNTSYKGNLETKVVKTM
jgi:hypothetical protein